MSKVQKIKKSKTTQPPPTVKPATKSAWGSRFSTAKFILALLPLGFAGLAVIFYTSLSNNPDFDNPMIILNKGLITFQYLLFTGITLCFGYFAWRYVNNVTDMTKIDRIVFGITFAGVCTLYITTFTKELSPNGDNAEYMIIAKSLVEHGTPLRLEAPSENQNTLASIGLPLMLAPIYKFWGFDVIKMKILILLLGISIFLLLYRFYLPKQGFALASLLGLTTVSSPYLVGNSTDVMTETPYLFWSLITILIILKYQQSKHFQWKYYFMVIGAIVMTYLTRAVGIGAFAALLIFLAWNISWTKLLGSDTRKTMIRSADFKKLFYIMGPLVIGAVAWQFWQQSSGVSQFKILFNSNIIEQLELNMRSAFRVLPQMLFSAETFRFQNFYSSATLAMLDWKYSAILFLMVIGLIEGVRQRKLISSYTIIVFLIIMVASLTPAEMVIMRYLSVLLPFIIYFTFLGMVNVTRFIIRRLRMPTNTALVKIASVMLLAQVLFTNMLGNSVNITLSVVGNGPAYQDFMDVARWAKTNLPENAYVMSVKPRIFYVMSEKKGTRLSTIEEQYSEEYEKEKLALFQRLGITHVVLDGISGSTRENIFPIVKNNPEMFQTLYIGATSGTSSINKIIYKKE